MKKLLYFDTSALIKEFDERDDDDVIAHDLITKVTTAAQEGHLQIVLSAWAINEATAVFDKKYRKEELTRPQLQTIMATLSQRIKTSSENASFRFAPVEHMILANSRELIARYHVSSNDALHLYTAWIYDCDYFLAQDKKFFNRVKPNPPTGLEIIDLSNEKDRKYLESQLGL